MHGLGTIKRLNREAQEKFEGKEIIEVKPDIQKKTESRQLFFKELHKRQSEED